MSSERLADIVDNINALRPDIDVIAGDFSGGSGFGTRCSAAQALAPLRRLKATLGVYAVLGNNDSNVAIQTSSALEAAGINVMINDVRRVGPIALGGVDGRLAPLPLALNAARQRTYRALARTPGVKVLLGHRPDEFPVAPEFVTLVLAGHTHCGQVALPLIGRLTTGSGYGRKYACGVYREGSKILVVSAGIGTSHLPLRIGVPPDIWLISIRGPRPAARD
jgi:predicted MPP superfamily phosphohydrolase